MVCGLQYDAGRVGLEVCAGCPVRRECRAWADPFRYARWSAGVVGGRFFDAGGRVVLELEEAG